MLDGVPLLVPVELPAIDVFGIPLVLDGVPLVLDGAGLLLFAPVTFVVAPLRVPAGLIATVAPGVPLVLIDVPLAPGGVVLRLVVPEKFDDAVGVGPGVTVPGVLPFVAPRPRPKLVATPVLADAPLTPATAPVLGFAVPPPVAVAPPRCVGVPPMPTVAPAMLGGGQLVLAVGPFCGVGLLNSPSLSSDASFWRPSAINSSSSSDVSSSAVSFSSASELAA